MGFLAYFVTFIPKVSSSLALKDYRPICLLGTLYKLLSKVLARRLVVAMETIISTSQSLFLKGRNFLDGVIMVNEIMDFMKRTKGQVFILKVDFEKANDSVD